MIAEDFPIGMEVWYEVATQAAGDFRVAAVVVDHTSRRVIVEFKHWHDGRAVRRMARPHRLTPRGGERAGA